MRKVFVGLSGGVDSAVSALLLKEQGYDVTGVFIKIWQPEFIECTWREDRLDAMRASAHLGIPFREIDLSDAYKREVVDAMIADYARGITPNPDVACNRSIKFGHFLDWAHSEGAEMIATGHYARIQKYGHGVSIFRGKDPNKDQSYFLWQLGQEALTHTFFPVGNLTKGKVRALAKKFGLPNAAKPDSQGICFLGDVSMEEFLARFIPLSRGAVLDTNGTAIGEHHGAALYTIGQRHGFTLDRTSGREHYVISMDANKNTITVSPTKLEVARSDALLRDLNWIVPPQFPFGAQAQARYRESPFRVRVEKKDHDTRVSFLEPHVVAPGQSLVLYDGDRCLGGGVIC